MQHDNPLNFVILGAIALQQPQLPPASAAFDLTSLEAKLAASAKPYLSFLDVPTMRMGPYRLEAGATDDQTPYPETSGRGSTRIFYWFGPGSAGQVEIDFGLPRWQAAFETFIQQSGGPRWRFGQDFWTRLDDGQDGATRCVSSAANDLSLRVRVRLVNERVAQERRTRRLAPPAMVSSPPPASR